jgi:hypothetical protein
MRCPRCHDDYEDGVVRCADCRIELVPEDQVDPDGESAAPADVDARLGRFHPAVAERIGELLFRRAIPHLLRVHDDGVEVLVERSWRDDLRTEFALGWNEVFRTLDEEVADEVRETGGSAPGWYDAPRGGHVDRHGRTVLDLDDQEEAATDAARVIGPLLLTTGAIAVVGGWYLMSSSAIVVTGIALIIVGLFTPR